MIAHSQTPNFLYFVSFCCLLICACLHCFVFRPGQSHGLSLAAMRRLLHLRVALAEFSLTVLEEHCAKEKRQALARETKTSAEITLEEFTRCPPEPGSLDEVRRCTKPSSECVKTEPSRLEQMKQYPSIAMNGNILDRFI